MGPEVTKPTPRRGLFVGLATLDIIHRVHTPPRPNEKITALAQFVAAGGPAANAAVTFAALGGKATLITALGTGTIADTIRAELASVGVLVIDIAPNLTDVAPVSAVAVVDSSGDRAVIGGDATGVQVAAPDQELLSQLVRDADVVLLDGHHPQLAAATVREVAQQQLPSVLDAGRWKPVMADLVTCVSDVVASADFRVPGTSDSQGTAAELMHQGTSLVVVTSGADPVRWWAAGETAGPDVSRGEVSVPLVDARDTLAAGDVFHGAYTFALAHRATVTERISFASRVAAVRCSMVGPRSWLSAIAELSLIPAAEFGENGD